MVVEMETWSEADTYSLFVQKSTSSGPVYLETITATGEGVFEEAVSELSSGEISIDLMVVYQRGLAQGLTIDQIKE